MCAVWVTNEASVTPHGGGGIRSQRLVRALAQVMSVEVVAIGGELDSARYCQVTDARSARAYAPPVRSRAATARLALSNRWPLSGVRLFHEQAFAEVQRAMATAQVLIVEHAFLLPYRPSGVRTVLSLQNVDSDQAASGAASPLENRWNAAMLRRAEGQSSRSKDVVVVAVSDVDARRVGADIVVANGTDLPAAPLRYRPRATCCLWGVWVTRPTPRRSAGGPRKSGRGWGLRLR